MRRRTGLSPVPDEPATLKELESLEAREPEDFMDEAREELGYEEEEEGVNPDHDAEVEQRATKLAADASRDDFESFTFNIE